MHAPPARLSCRLAPHPSSSKRGCCARRKPVWETRPYAASVSRNSGAPSEQQHRCIRHSTTTPHHTLPDCTVDPFANLQPSSLSPIRGGRGWGIRGRTKPGSHVPVGAPSEQQQHRCVRHSHTAPHVVRFLCEAVFSIDPTLTQTHAPISSHPIGAGAAGASEAAQSPGLTDQWGHPLSSSSSAEHSKQPRYNEYGDEIVDDTDTDQTDAVSSAFNSLMDDLFEDGGDGLDMD